MGVGKGGTVSENDSPSNVRPGLHFDFNVLNGDTRLDAKRNFTKQKSLVIDGYRPDFNG